MTKELVTEQDMGLFPVSYGQNADWADPRMHLVSCDEGIYCHATGPRTHSLLYVRA